jgi:hypothetical protein
MKIITDPAEMAMLYTEYKKAETVEQLETLFETNQVSNIDMQTFYFDRGIDPETKQHVIFAQNPRTGKKFCFTTDLFSEFTEETIKPKGGKHSSAT